MGATNVLDEDAVALVRAAAVVRILIERIGRATWHRSCARHDRATDALDQNMGIAALTMAPSAHSMTNATAGSNPQLVMQGRPRMPDEECDNSPLGQCRRFSRFNRPCRSITTPSNPVLAIMSHRPLSRKQQPKPQFSNGAST
jgi:hypothetical protein